MHHHHHHQNPPTLQNIVVPEETDEQIQSMMMDDQQESYVISRHSSSTNNSSTRRSRLSDIISQRMLRPFSGRQGSTNRISSCQQQLEQRDSVNSYYLARNSRVSANSMPQFPCTAKSRSSIRKQHHHSLPRSPRIPSSLSDIIYKDYDQNSITEIPLNTGDDDDDDDNIRYHNKNEKQHGNNHTLHGASSSQTLVAMPYYQYHPQSYYQQQQLQPHQQLQPNKQKQQRQSWRATATESIFSFLSAPSKISRTTTQHYVFSPPSLAELQGVDEITTEKKTNKGKPSQRGICNSMTIATVIIVILFLFAGYPLSVHIAKQTSENNSSNSDSSSSSSSSSEIS